METHPLDFVMLRDGSILWCDGAGGFYHMPLLAEHFKVDLEYVTPTMIEQKAIKEDMIRGVFNAGRYVATPFKESGAPTAAQLRELRDLALFSGYPVSAKLGFKRWEEYEPRMGEAYQLVRTLLSEAKLVHPSKLRGEPAYSLYTASRLMGDIITAAAIQFPDGTTVTGRDHPEAWANAQSIGLADETRSGAEEGFVSRSGYFFNRKDAFAHAKSVRQLDNRYATDPNRLDSLDVV
jgi:hypothetical protein